MVSSPLYPCLHYLPPTKHFPTLSLIWQGFFKMLLISNFLSASACSRHVYPKSVQTSRKIWSSQVSIPQASLWIFLPCIERGFLQASPLRTLWLHFISVFYWFVTVIPKDSHAANIFRNSLKAELTIKTLLISSMCCTQGNSMDFLWYILYTGLCFLH